MTFIPQKGGGTLEGWTRHANASNANNIQAIVAPRVLRFGFRVNW